MARGHEVHIACAKWDGDDIPGVHLHLAPGKYGREFALAAVTTLNRLGPDTFLSLERAPQSPLVRAGDGCHASWLERRSRHENPLKRVGFKLNPKHRATLELEREMFTWPGLQKVIANSRMVAGELDEYFGLGPDRVEVIYNGVDQAALAPALDPKVEDLGPGGTVPGQGRAGAVVLGFRVRAQGPGFCA